MSEKVEREGSPLLDQERLRQMAEETVGELELDDGIRQIAFETIAANINSCLGEAARVSGLMGYRHVQRRFGKERERIGAEHPEIEHLIPGFCHILKTKVALLLHPERLEQLADFLRQNETTVINPLFIFRQNHSLYSWFTTHCRNRIGAVDWPAIHRETRKLTDCSLEYRTTNRNLDVETLLDLARERIDELVERNGVWYPSDLRGGAPDLYEALREIPEFRREDIRPDIEMRRNDRPNWLAVARRLGERYVASLRIGPGEEDINEMKFRTFDTAIRELIDLLQELNADSWNAHMVYVRNDGLYNWLREHYLRERGEPINWNDICSHLPSKLSSKFQYHGFGDRPLPSWANSDSLGVRTEDGKHPARSELREN